MVGMSLGLPEIRDRNRVDFLVVSSLNPSERSHYELP